MGVTYRYMGISYSLKDDKEASIFFVFILNEGNKRKTCIYTNFYNSIYLCHICLRK